MSVSRPAARRENYDGLSNSERKRLLRAKVAASNADRQTAFRRAEKRYMTRIPPPDYSQVIDLHGDGISRFSDHVSVHELLTDLFELGGSCRTAYTLDRHPGAILIPNALSSVVQRRLVKECLRETARPPNVSNLDTHYALPEHGIWNAHEEDIRRHAPTLVQPRHVHTSSDQADGSNGTGRSLTQNEPGSLASLDDVPKTAPAASSTVVAQTASELLYKLRWTNIGLLYHWSTKSYHFEHVLGSSSDDVVRVPASLAAISRQLLQSIPDHLLPAGQSWHDFQPEAGIINHYQLRSTLMATSTTRS